MPPPALPQPEHPYLASAVPGSIPLFYLLLLLLPLLLGGGLREVLGFAELLGGLCHGAAVTAAASVAVAPALLAAPSTSCPCFHPCLHLSPRAPVAYCLLFLLSGGHAMCVTQGGVSSRYVTAATRQPPASTKGRCYSEWC